MATSNIHTAVRCLLTVCALLLTCSVSAIWTGEPRLENRYKENGFLAACREDNLDAVKYYIESEQIDSNGYYECGYSGNRVTGLYLASALGHARIVEALLTAGADRDMTCNNETPLFIACLNNWPEVVKHLVRDNTDIDQICHQVTSLYVASQKGHHHIVEILIATGADVNKMCNGMTPLHIASYKGHDLVVDKILAHGEADVNQLCLGITPLYLASYYGHEGVVEHLLAARADPQKGCYRSWLLREQPRSAAKRNQPCLRVLNRDRYDRYRRIITRLDEATASRKRQEYPLRPLSLPRTDSVSERITPVLLTHSSTHSRTPTPMLTPSTLTPQPEDIGK